MVDRSSNYANVKCKGGDAKKALFSLQYSWRFNIVIPVDDPRMILLFEIDSMAGQMQINIELQGRHHLLVGIVHA